MIFLIEYDRLEGRITTFRDYRDTERKLAQDSRLAIELELNRKDINHEVVLLEASDEAALRRTHSRYFKKPDQLLKSATFAGN